MLAAALRPAVALRQAAAPWHTARRGFSTRTLQVRRHVAAEPLQLFKAVADVTAYPEFLPYCARACVLEEGHCQLLVALDFEHRLVQETVIYNVQWTTPSKVVSIAQDTQHCKRIEFQWEIQPHGPAGDSSLVDMQLSVDFRSRTTAFLFDSFADPIKERIMEAFAQRVVSSST
mmetsp:Transcript_10324/g.26217  ORF Transcript_10324/g.26217 Transcript_10324/m.26217 type:complete len:174 (-) Transcript_10324:448-969(-)